MISLLQSILCVLRNLVLGVVWALCEVLNLLVLAVGEALGALVQLLPDLPGAPPSIDNDVLATVNWILPVGTLLGLFGAFFALWMVFWLVRRLANTLRAGSL